MTFSGQNPICRALAVSTCLAISPLLAGPGDLDTTFGDGGKVTTACEGAFTFIQCTAVLPDGRILAAGFADYATSFADYFVALVRYLPDGRIDTSFGNEGKVILDANRSRPSRATAMVLLPGGQFLVAGYLTNGRYDDFALYRFLEDGSPDVSFGNGGLVTMELGHEDERADSMAIQASGRIVVGITARNEFGHPLLKLVGFLPDGSLDPSFGDNGIVSTGVFSQANGVTIQADGKIIITGALTVSRRTDTGTLIIIRADRDFLVIRYHPDGSLDTSFGEDGIASASYPGTNEDGNDLALQSDGKILVCGTSINSDLDDRQRNEDVSLVRFNPDGSHDLDFGDNGIVRTDLSDGNDVAQRVSLLPDGRFVIAGSAPTDNGTFDFLLASFHPDGSLDHSFGRDGIVGTDFGGYSDVGNSLTIQPDGKFLVGGSASNGIYWDFALARYHARSFQADSSRSYQADNCIGARADQLIGRGVINYNSTGQSIKLTTVGHHKVRFYFSAKNAGDSTDTLGLRAKRGNRFFKIKYRQDGAGNVTGEITRNLLSTPDLAPGAATRFKATITPRMTRGKKRWAFTILTKSHGDPSRGDRVRAIVAGKP